MFLISEERRSRKGASRPGLPALPQEQAGEAWGPSPWHRRVDASITQAMASTSLETLQPQPQADGCSLLRIEPGRLVIPELGAEWARAEGCGVWQVGSHSRCSWLDQDTSSALRDPGPSSTERTLSANLRE